MTNVSPKDLLDLFHAGLKPKAFVAWDTETSGLYADDGARVSTVSVAWPDYEGEWLDFAHDDKFMTWNIETINAASNYQVPIVSVAWPFDQGVANTGKPEDKGQQTLWAEADNLDAEQWDALNRWLTLVGRDVGLTAHNAPFDVLVTEAGVRTHGGGAWLLSLVEWDTQNANHMLWPLRMDPEKNKPTTSLKPTTRDIFGMDIADESKTVQNYLKKKKLPPGRWDLMPWDIIGGYADKDARLTVMLRLFQEWSIDNGLAGEWFGTPEKVRAMLDRRLAVSKLVTKMERRGVPYAEVESRDAADECMRIAAEVAADLPFDPTPDAAKEWFFTDKGLDLPAYELTDKGAVSLTEDVLVRMVNDDVPHAARYMEYRKVVNAASMWYTGYADKMGTDGRLRMRVRVNGTVSSRFSAERVNLQAIPQDYRLSSHSILDGIPTPRSLIGLGIQRLDGYAGWELDLAQAELRVGAMFAKCDKMLEMIANNEDLHAFTTKELFPQIDPDGPEFFKYRQVGKRGNFSLGFGSGGETFRRMIRKETGIDLGVAGSDRIVRTWNRLYPEWGAAIDKHMTVVTRRQNKHKQGWIDLLNGERRWFQRFEDTHKAFNQRVQGNLAQFGIDWMLQSNQYLESCGLDSFREGLVLTIHDSQVLLLPDTAEGEEMAKACAEFGRSLWKEWFPGVPGDVDTKRWDKAA